MLSWNDCITLKQFSQIYKQSEFFSDYWTNHKKPRQHTHTHTYSLTHSKCTKVKKKNHTLIINILKKIPFLVMYTCNLILFGWWIKEREKKNPKQCYAKAIHVDASVILTVYNIWN